MCIRDRGLPLELVNLPKMSFEVTKVFRNLWEHSFTQKDYLMPGARIALYEKLGDGSLSLIHISVSNTPKSRFVYAFAMAIN